MVLVTYRLLLPQVYVIDKSEHAEEVFPCIVILNPRVTRVKLESLLQLEKIEKSVEGLLPGSPQDAVTVCHRW